MSDNIKSLVWRLLEKSGLQIRFLFPRPSTKFIKRNLKGPLIGVEIGTYKAINAKSLLKTLKPQRLYLVDPYTFYDKNDSSSFGLKKVETQAKKLLIHHKNAIFIKETSEKAVSLIPNNLDFVYIDGNHNYEFVKKDIVLYYKKLRKGGILAGHDFDYTFPGVIKAVSEFCVRNKINFLVLHGDWWLIKK